ncbi:TylF/MycF/NovP-related O-methyltransferase [Pannonibacter phragmitetus]|uniref:TylF/MycF/NovP-related O-methyltransferase n=1 Tax=Pannonibacter phragmitetus TaxID=121719 RepID=UPI003D2F208C
MTQGTDSIQGLSPGKVWDYENGFYWFSDPSRLNKMLAHYELYKRIIGLPGDVLEFGVFKGLSLIRFAQFRALLEAEASRRIIGFDAFGDFPAEGLSDPSDHKFIEKFETEAGKGLAKAELAAILEAKRIGNVDLVEGNVFQTLPDYLARHPHLRISLLHLDMDVGEPTRFALEQLFERVVPGGLVLVDDYNAVAGATNAVDGFLRAAGGAAAGLSLQKLPNYRVPAFFVRP